jgi:serine O-acetyltransferase
MMIFDYYHRKLLDIYDSIIAELNSIRERDPAAKSNTEVAMLYSGFHALCAYRVAHALQIRGHTFAARAISQTARFLTGIEIHPGATIGRGLFIDHGSGVVIGETTVIGNNCTLYQGVTLGGTGKHTGKRHPTLGNNVMVGAGAKVLGPITIGDNSKIAAGAVVLMDIPADCTAVGIPARIVRRGNVRVERYDLDHVHIPDPISQELCALRMRLERLEKKLADKIDEADKDN